jgi:hypothetical protein
MRKTVVKLLGVSMVGLAALVSGCATTAQLEEVRVTANEAKKAAADAQATANRAVACCNDTNAKIDRMFQKSMRK